MNDRLVLLNNRLLNNDHLIMHHDSNKLLSNDSIYQTDSRYTVSALYSFIFYSNPTIRLNWLDFDLDRWRNDWRFHYFGQWTIEWFGAFGINIEQSSYCKESFSFFQNVSLLFKRFYFFLKDEFNDERRLLQSVFLQSHVD